MSLQRKEIAEFFVKSERNVTFHWNSLFANNSWNYFSLSYLLLLKVHCFTVRNTIWKSTINTRLRSIFREINTLVKLAKTLIWRKNVQLYKYNFGFTKILSNHVVSRIFSNEKKNHNKFTKKQGNKSNVSSFAMIFCAFTKKILPEIDWLQK